MSYVEKNLLLNENIVFHTNRSWIGYLSGIIFIVIGLLLFKNPAGFSALLTIGLVSFYFSYLRIKNTEIAVTNKRVLIKVGIFKTNSIETVLSKIEGIHVEQSLFGKLFNFGTITVKGTGGTNNNFKGIDKPMEFRRAVNQQIEDLTLKA